MEPSPSDLEEVPRDELLCKLSLKQQKFIIAMAACGSARRACKLADVSLCSLWRWRHTDPNFLTAYIQAREDSIVLLEDEAWRRAYEGNEKPVTVAGKREVIREYSDTLLIFLLKANVPAKYRDNTVNFRADLTVSSKKVDELSDEALAAIAYRGLLPSKKSEEPKKKEPEDESWQDQAEDV